MSRMTPEATVVALLDWQGRLVWSSRESVVREFGRPGEEYLRSDLRERGRQVLTQVINHRKSQQLQMVNDRGEHYRVWMWPLDSPEVAVCLLCIYIPEELAKLTLREQDCLKLLAFGLAPATIAEKLKVTVSTVHTHLKRSREKLGLPSLESLISFAARHCNAASERTN